MPVCPPACMHLCHLGPAEIAVHARALRLCLSEPAGSTRYMNMTDWAVHPLSESNASEPKVEREAIVTKLGDKHAPFPMMILGNRKESSETS